MIKKNVTMSDVAKAVGVSTVSVSKAITGKDGVSDSMRENILKKAEELGYRYISFKKEKAEERRNIGIIVSEIFITRDLYYSRLYEKTMMMLGDENQVGLLEIVRKEHETSVTPPIILSSGQIEGLIVLGQMSKEYLLMLRSFDLPVLYLDFYDEDVFEDAVISDSVFGSGLLTNYLIHKGHKRIAFVGSIHSTSSIMDRYLGYYRAMLEAGLTIEEGWLIEDRDENRGRIPPLLPDNMPTAFVCNSDATAYELVRQLQKAGYNVPEDISVVAFDNFIYAQMSSPEITTYGVDTDGMVVTAVRIMLEKIENKDCSMGRVLVPGTMIERESVKTLDKAF